MEIIWLFAAIFLPLFPASALFNILFRRTSSAWGRISLLLLWPQLGIALLAYAPADPPEWLMVWGISSALLYAFRALVLRDLLIWISFSATSAWALFWLVSRMSDPLSASLQLLGFSLPFALLTLIAAALERRFGAAFAGLPGGVAQSLPRLSLLLLLSMLAAVATPIFPAFFTLLATILKSAVASPVVTLMVAVVWLLWSWSSARLLQALLIGPGGASSTKDLDSRSTSIFAAALVFLAVAGLILAGRAL